MLLRQKILLSILDALDKPLSPTRLVKLAFLLGEESDLQGACVYYDFVPYKFGPFSFALYRELESLRCDGYVSPDEKKVTLCRSTRAMTRAKVEELPECVRSAVSETVTRHGRQSQRALVKSVYTQYPWYTINSELTDLIPDDAPQRPRTSIAVYTAGYEGKSVDRFFDELIRAGIEAVLDVRCNPVSRKYGFAGKSFKEIGSKLGLGYHHLPELGISSKDRGSLDDYESYQRLLNRYEQDWLPRQEEGIQRASELVRQRPSVLVCMEKDVRCCHRSRLAKIVSKRTRLPVVHL